MYITAPHLTAHTAVSSSQNRLYTSKTHDNHQTVNPYAPYFTLEGTI